MRIDVITLFPELVEQVIACGVVGRAAESGLLQLECWNPRDFTLDKHRTVDDRPYGGGPGMLLKPEPMFEAVRDLSREKTHVVLFSPAGRTFNQAIARELAQHVRLQAGAPPDPRRYAAPGAGRPSRLLPLPTARTGRA